MEKRSNFQSPWIFVLAAIGSAAGLGNLWRFPYLAYEHGGAAFYLAYFVCLLCIGLPLLIAEIGMGQLTRHGAPQALVIAGKSNRFRLLGWLAVMVSFFILTYYIVITSWTLNFAANALDAPWQNGSQHYFLNVFLNQSESITQINDVNFFIMLGAGVTILLLFVSIHKGTSGISNIATYVTPVPLILLLVLMINSIQLPGAQAGLKALFFPKWHYLTTWDLWFDAASQVLFSLSLAFGVMIAYGAILDQTIKIRRLAITVILGDTIIASIGGMIVFSVLGQMALVQNTPINEVVSSGVGLAFIVIPEALTYLPTASSLFTLIFYISLFLLAFTSIVSLFESILAALMDSKLRLKRSALLAFVCLIIYTLSLLYVGGNGIYLIDIVDHFVSGYGIYFVSILQCIAIGWIYDAERLRYNLRKSTGLKLSGIFNVLLRLVIPIVLSILLFNQISQDVTKPYEGYPTMFLLTFGVGSLILMAAIGSFCSRKLH